MPKINFEWEFALAREIIQDHTFSILATVLTCIRSFDSWSFVTFDVDLDLLV